MQAFDSSKPYNPLLPDFADGSATVFEGKANVNAAAANDMDSLKQAYNELAVTYDRRSNDLHWEVNGADVKSAVTKQKMDRSLLGGYRPNNDPNTLTSIMVEAGGYVHHMSTPALLR